MVMLVNPVESGPTKPQRGEAWQSELQPARQSGPSGALVKAGRVRRGQCFLHVAAPLLLCSTRDREAGFCGLMLGGGIRGSRPSPLVHAPSAPGHRLLRTHADSGVPVLLAGAGAVVGHCTPTVWVAMGARCDGDAAVKFGKLPRRSVTGRQAGRQAGRQRPWHAKEPPERCTWIGVASWR